MQGGWDTDSNGATAGSGRAACLLGAAALPAHFVDPLEDRVRSALFGFDDSRISDLAARTTRLARASLAADEAGRDDARRRPVIGADVA